MPMDMPPAAPTYSIERAAPATSPMMRAVSAARNAALTPVGSVADHDALVRILPRIDVTSAALTGGDRSALVASAEANRGSRLSGARISLPDSYVGQRIKLAIANSRMHDAQARGDLDLAMARDVGCRMVALVMDTRAGAYVMGGERAAAQSRAAVPKEMIDRCRRAASASVGREGVCTTPHRGSQVATRVRIDPTPSTRVRVDPAPSTRVRIDPTPSKRTSVSPGAAAARAAAAAGRSI